MVKKIVKVEDTKKTKKSSVDLGKIASAVMENKEAALKIVDGIEDIISSQNNKKTTKSKTTKTTSKKNTKSDLDSLIDLAGTILKK